MPSMHDKLPIGKLNASQDAVIRSVQELGELVRAQRKTLGLNQLDVAGLGNTGNRFIVELERGKPTVQLNKVLAVMDLLGLEMVVRPKSSGVFKA